MEDDQPTVLLTLSQLADARQLPPEEKPTGLLLIDKPSAWTSHDVVNKVRRISGIKKIGHAGTLDPLATGLLLILVGRNYTKRQAEFMHQEKVYEVTGQLGFVSDTYDVDGQVETAASWDQVSSVTQEALAAVAAEFKGKINQRVPAFSAVKKNGQKLYELARSGEIREEELPSREVTIHDLVLTAFTSNQSVHEASFALRVKCSSGTYIRSLVHDIGQRLEVGAVVTQLRRISSGKFHVSEAQKLEK